MIRQLFTIFLPISSPKRMIPMVGVVLTLSIGIGVFWMIQSLMENYFDGLIQMVLLSKEEIAIVKNPQQKFMTEEEREEEFFSGKKMDMKDRMMISTEQLAQMRDSLKEYDGKIQIQGMWKNPDADFVGEIRDTETHYKPLLVVTDISPECRALPLFDTLSEEQIAEFMNTEQDSIPFLVTHSLMSNVKKGDTISLTYDGKKNTFHCVGFVEQGDLFAIPMMFVSVSSMEKISGPVKFNVVAVRTEDYRSPVLAEEIKTRLGDGFFVTHWSDMLKILNGVFNSINLVITLIVSSLFVMAFFFSVVAFDLIIKKRRKHLAMFLAMGMPPRKIRNGLICVSGVIGVIGLAVGLVFAWIFLQIIPHTPLEAVFSQMFVKDFSLRFDTHILLLIAGMTFVATVGSAWFSARRVFRIDPVQDLKK